MHLKSTHLSENTSDLKSLALTFNSKLISGRLKLGSVVKFQLMKHGKHDKVKSKKKIVTCVAFSFNFSDQQKSLNGQIKLCKDGVLRKQFQGRVYQSNGKNVIVLLL